MGRQQSVRRLLDPLIDGARLRPGAFKEAAMTLNKTALRTFYRLTRDLESEDEVRTMAEKVAPRFGTDADHLLEVYGDYCQFNYDCYVNAGYWS